MDADVRLLEFLHGAHMLVFTECGVEVGEMVPDLEGYVCVQHLGRIRSYKCGGVTVYVQAAYHTCVTVVRSHADLGILWLCVALPHVRRLYVACCYIPHHGSDIHSDHGQQASFSVLHKDISEFKGKGGVMLIGDFNGRVGCELDYDLVGMWDSVSNSTVFEPPFCVPARNTCDAVGPNAQGRDILQLCKDMELVILNGRLPNDAMGAFTYKQHGGKGVSRKKSKNIKDRQSLIDYCLAEPALFFTPEGNVHNGCDMSVAAWESMPPAVRRCAFDHVPITVNVMLHAAGGSAVSNSGTDHAAQPLQRIKWDATAQAAYVGLLQSDGEVLGILNQISGCGGDGVQANALLHQALVLAVQKLSLSGFKVLSKAGGVAPSDNTHHHTHKAWYDGECKRLRSVLREHEYMYGQCDATQAARCAYITHVRAAKRRYKEQCMNAVVDDWYRDPRKFWSAFKQNKNSAGIDDIQAWTSYFESLFAANRQGKYHGDSLEQHLAHFHQLFPDASDANTDAAHGLSANFTVSEVQAALSAMQAHKSAGPDGLPAEYLMHAVYHNDDDNTNIHVLAPYITHVFNLVLQNGYPAEWAACALTPVPKPKGNPAVMDNYRGIAVGGALSKLFSIVLTARLDAWAERGGWRAAGQAGFRSGRGTTDNAFVLQHLIEKYTVDKKQLFTAFIDFRKAYDCVDRELLWRKLQGMGLHGRMLTVLQGMYEHVRMQVRCHGTLGAAFEAGIGVKQGDPLSPLLFGLFIDRLEQYMRDQLSDCGVDFAATATFLLQVLLYADDLVLCAGSAEQLQRMLDCLQQFCTANCMAVNVSKSCVVVFNKAACPSRQIPEFTLLQSDGTRAAIPQCNEFTYLGIKFGDACHVKESMLDSNMTKARHCLAAMLHKCTQLRIHNVRIRCFLFNTLVLSVLNYGCVVWGVYHLSSLRTKWWGSKGSVEQLHKDFLCRILQVKSTVSTGCLMHETGRVPVIHGWLQQTLHWWNKIAKRDDNDIVKLALVDSVRLHQAGHKCWAASFVQALRSFMGVRTVVCRQGDRNSEVQLTELLYDVQRIPVAQVMSALTDAWTDKLWSDAQALSIGRQVGDLSDSERIGFKLFKYKKWCMDTTSFVSFVNVPKRIHVLAQFRLCSHRLNCETTHARTRSQRVCTCCTANVCENEMHMLECAAYQHLRVQFADLFTFDDLNDTAMHQFMCKGGDAHAWNRLADFLLAVVAHRATLITSN